MQRHRFLSFGRRLVLVPVVVLGSSLGVGCGGLAHDGASGGGASLDGSSDSGGAWIGTGGEFKSDGVVDEGSWTGTGATTTGGASGTSGLPLCLECFPYGSSCAQGDLTYRLSWGSACPPDLQCNAAHHTCELGCREEGAQWGIGEEAVFSHCEETSVRGPGFPCRGDIDCVTPIGATLASTLTDTSGLGGAGSDTGELHCSEERVCASGLSGAATNDLGASCSITTPSSRPGSVVGFAATCAGGACLVPEGGQPEGSCTTSCETEADCSPGYSCTDVLDGRYSAWHFVADLVEPPRISACVPNED